MKLFQKKKGKKDPMMQGETHNKPVVSVSATATPSTAVRYVTKHDFRGNPNKRQVSFRAGEVVTYDSIVQPSEGWVWVTVLSTNQEGWCPQAYLVPENAPPPASAPPPPPTSAAPGWLNNGNHSDGNSGIFGSAMGGKPQQPTEQVVFATATPVAAAAGASWLSRNGSRTPSATPVSAEAGVPQQPGTGVRGAFAKFGEDVQRVGKNSWTAVSNGAQVVGAQAINGAQAVGSQAQQTYSGFAQQQEEVSKKHPWQRTKGEQRAVDIGNGAARGAVVHGATRAVFNPTNPAAIARSAAFGAVFHGSCAGTKGWKPFG